MPLFSIRTRQVAAPARPAAQPRWTGPRYRDISTAVGTVFYRARTVGNARTLYMVTAYGPIIIGAVGGRVLDNGDKIGGRSAYVKSDTPIVACGLFDGLDFPPRG